MYFKKLEIVGFKSFCNKTSLHFEPGITAVVGPNGCGKSNIFDAIRWVLGEQSIKSLRGSQMEDVIFNGTDSKEALSMAEVSVSFDNSKRFFPVDHNEVMITRRVFRSGESEYLLNKTLVRLKDINEILMGTGIGAESYSLVQQGKIDLVLSSKPEDRRLIFDEASGITKYKVQKKEAFKKLEETEQNLLRVNDIVTEVKRQIGSLERQANKARRYKEVFEDLKSKEIKISLLQKKNIARQKEEIINQISQLESKELILLKIIQEEESKIIDRQTELKTLEDNLMDTRKLILNQENLVSRNNEHIDLNRERIIDLKKNKEYIETQLLQTQNRLLFDEEKLNKVQQEYSEIKNQIDEKSRLLAEKENLLNTITSSTKLSLENIAKAKRNIIETAARIANVKNEISDLFSKRQIHLARKKRLEIERAKINEEISITEEDLNLISKEVEDIEKIFADLNSKLSLMKNNLLGENLSLEETNSDIQKSEGERLSLVSQKEFLEKLRLEYEGIGESMNAVIYLDKPPQEKTGGLVIKIKDYLELNETNNNFSSSAKIKISGEAKPIDLDTKNINEKINLVQETLEKLKNIKSSKETHIEELNKEILIIQDNIRKQEMVLVNKKTTQQTILDQFNKLKEEADIIGIELSDVDKNVFSLEEKSIQMEAALSELDKEQKATEDLITNEQNRINTNGQSKEEVLVIITQARTEVEALNKRIGSDEATLKMLKDTYNQNKESALNLQRQIEELNSKKETLQSEINDIENKTAAVKLEIERQNELLKNTETKYKELSTTSGDVLKKIEEDRKETEIIRNNLYQLEMKNKDLEFKYLSLKERLLQAYKTDIDNVIENTSEELNESLITEEIRLLKEKADSYGTVNLVAIEEYDELKKRYDFLTQQQNDLFSAKESLREAILKINRTAKKMFIETFEKVKIEFRDYFRLLFNGGDAQLFLIDEQDPLESGIEIICRPPGKKLQNVLLLSGGEKSLSAIALIFAIFKVKPAPFCILDEIDAALDEANVDRFSRSLHKFTENSQFIIITHNKKTIANADVMYGITMEESGVSKIVSVKLGKNNDPVDNINKENDIKAVPETV